jgi:peroxiredoxin
MTSRTRTRAARTRKTPRRDDRRRWQIGIPLAIGLIAIAFVLGSQTQGGETLATGAAPAFDLPTSDGASISLEAMRGHPVLLYFSEGVGCDSCFAQLADIEASSSAFDQLGVHIVPIMVNQASDVTLATADFGIRTPIALDTTKVVSEEYGVLGTGMHAGLPGHSFILVDATGTIRWEQSFPSMYVPSDELARTIADHLD